MSLSVLRGPSRLPLEALLRRSFSTSAPNSFSTTSANLSRRRPQPYPFKLPKPYRKGAQDVVYGYEPGQRRPKKPKRVVAHLTQTVYLNDNGESKLLGHAGETAAVDKSIMRKELVPQGKAYYVRHGQPVVWPLPLRDWVPPDVKEARLQAYRDKQIGFLHTRKVITSLAEQNEQKMRELSLIVERNKQRGVDEAFAGGLSRLQKWEALIEQATTAEGVTEEPEDRDGQKAGQAVPA